MASPTDRMLRDIAQEYRATESYTGRSCPSEVVETAMRRVPREAFVPRDKTDNAYDNRPLAIGEGQTISQPFIVALMTDCLVPEASHRVLEIGTGCGYQAAVLAEIVAEVYSVEAIATLGDTARERLHGLGYENIHLRIGNGRDGWPQAAPFDGIIVTAGAEDVPAALLDQLAPGGRMVIPVGAISGRQDLLLLRKDDAGGIARQSILPVAFVPLVGA